MVVGFKRGHSATGQGWARARQAVLRANGAAQCPLPTALVSCPAVELCRPGPLACPVFRIQYNLAPCVPCVPDPVSLGRHSVPLLPWGAWPPHVHVHGLLALYACPFLPWIPCQAAAIRQRVAVLTQSAPCLAP